MNTVWKYDLEVTDVQEILLPEGAEVLAVAEQYGKPRLWALVDSARAAVARAFFTAGTGHVLPEEDLRHVGTYQLGGGGLVFHVFEVLL